MLRREQAARASAEEASRLKDQFLAMVSHELRTPLSAIVGWSDMLRSGKLPATDREKATEAIYCNARRQARMIDELLDVARITSGKLRLERTAVNLEQVVRDALDVVQVAADAKGVQIDGPSIRGRNHLRRRRPPAADRVEPALERRQVHARRRPGAPRSAPRQHNSRSSRSRDNGIGRSAGLPAVRVRAVQPGRRVDPARPWRARSGTVDREAAGRSSRRSISVTATAKAAARPSPCSCRWSRMQSEHIVRSPAARRPTKTRRRRSKACACSSSTTTRRTARPSPRTWRASARRADGGSAAEALELLKRAHVDVLLSDIAMPLEDGYTLIRKSGRWTARRANPGGRPDRAGPRRRPPAVSRRRVPAAPGQADRFGIADRRRRQPCRIAEDNTHGPANASWPSRRTQG